MTAHCIPAWTRGTFISFSLAWVTMVPWSTLTCKAIHLVLCEILCQQVVKLLEEKVIYHASATVEARGRSTIITVCFTVHSNVARYTITGISIYQVLRWSVRPQGNDNNMTLYYNHLQYKLLHSCKDLADSHRCWLDSYCPQIQWHTHIGMH